KEVEVMLADEEFRAVNCIGTCRRGNRYILHSDRIGARAASIVNRRINEQVKRNIQGKVIDVDCSDITTGRPAAVVHRPRPVSRISRAGWAPSTVPTVHNINQRSVGAGRCGHLYFRIRTETSKSERVNVVRPEGAVTAVIIRGKCRYRIIRTGRIAGGDKGRGGGVVSSRNSSARTIVGSAKRGQHGEVAF